MLVALALCVPAAAAAKYEIPPGGFAVRALDAAGEPEVRAGSHPDRFQVDFAVDAEGTTTRDLAFDMPPGFSGGTGSVPLCSRQAYEEGEECPPESQVGESTLVLGDGTESKLPIYELEPKPDELIAFGSVAELESALHMELRPDDLGLTLEAIGLPDIDLAEGRIEFWGVPADHQTGAPIDRRPFITLPTRCGPARFGFRARSAEPGADWVRATAQTESLEGCESLPFAPKVSVALTDSRADSPTGTRLDLEIEQNDDPDGVTAGQVEETTISLPPGLSVSPGGSADKVACTDAQFGLGNGDAPACPAASRVGSVEVVTPALAQPLVGNAYLGEERPGERFRLFVAAIRQGAVIKLVNTLQTDSATGRLSAHLEDLPQMPLQRMSLRLDGGDRALLATPLTCGIFSSRATFVTHGGMTAAVPLSMTVNRGVDGGPCPPGAPFSPLLEIESANNTAGHSNTVSLTLRRRPGEQLAQRFVASMPVGLSAELGKIEPCPDDLAASGNCPLSSKVGTASAEVGSGPSPLVLRGNAYAAGAYEDAPFSVVLVLNASIGPFDLGVSAVRSAIRIDPKTARVTVATDGLPTVIEGVPIRLRTIGLTLDRRGIVRNPTSCAPFTYDVAVEATDGATVNLSHKFRSRGCRRLGLDPRISVSLVGRSQMHEGGTPGLRIATRLRRGDTALRSMRVAMPSALRFRLAGLAEICPRRDAREGLCTERARVGTAFMRTPLLSDTLTGAVYVVQPPGDGLPEFWIKVAAEGLKVNMQARTVRRGGRLYANLTDLPDVPLSRFILQLRGGKRGSLSLTVPPCGKKGERALRSPAFATGQNGIARTWRLRAKAPCGDRG